MSDGRRIPFLEEDERRIASAAFWGVIVSLASLATAAIHLASIARGMAFGSSLVSVVYPCVQIVLNVWLLRASLAFRKVGAGSHGDRARLLVGFRRLRSFFILQVISTVALIGALVLGAVLETRRPPLQNVELRRVTR